MTLEHINANHCFVIRRGPRAGIYFRTKKDLEKFAGQLKAVSVRLPRKDDPGAGYDGLPVKVANDLEWQAFVNVVNGEKKAS